MKSTPQQTQSWTTQHRRMIDLLVPIKALYFFVLKNCLLPGYASVALFCGCIDLSLYILFLFQFYLISYSTSK